VKEVRGEERRHDRGTGKKKTFKMAEKVNMVKMNEDSFGCFCR